MAVRPIRNRFGGLYGLRGFASEQSLTLTRAFEGAGLKSDDAERIATEIYDNVATKADLRSGAGALHAELREMKQRFESRFEKIERRIDRMVVRLSALAVVVAGLLFAALQRWPPH